VNPAVTDSDTWASHSLKRYAEEVPMTIVAVNGGGNTPNGVPSVPREDKFDFTTEPTMIAGDFDNDGDVDGRDFLVWQRGSTPDDGDASITDGTSNTVAGDGSVRFLQDSIDVYIYV
jgi:hypothetical protein